MANKNLCFAFRGNSILIRTEPEAAIPTEEELSAAKLPLRRITPFTKDEYPGYVIGEVPEDVSPPPGMDFAERRSIWSLLGERTFALSGLAFHLLDWQRNSRYCGRCATPMENSTLERARVCPSCGFVSYPVICPAVIMTVEREGKILLAHNAHFPEGRYSVLAGFVEPGESLEDAVRREVREEVGVELTDIRYFGSQPWPFPRSLMAGFTTRWSSREIHVDGREIVDAGWFAPEDMPDIPASISISRRLIDDFLRRNRNLTTEDTENTEKNRN